MSRTSLRRGRPRRAPAAGVVVPVVVVGLVVAVAVGAARRSSGARARRGRADISRAPRCTRAPRARTPSGSIPFDDRPV